MSNKIPLKHPEIILKEEFLDAFEITAYAVSKATGIPQTALCETLKGKRNISPINALKISKFFEMSESYFLNVQMQYDLDLAKKKAKYRIIL